MNLSMYDAYAFWLNYENNEDAFRHFYEKGVQYIDIIDMNDELTQMFPLHLRCNQIRDGGLIPQALVTVHNIASHNKNERERNMALLKGHIDQMSRLGIPVLMSAPAVASACSTDEFKRTQELLIKGFAEACEYAEGSGISVVIENQSSLLRPDSKIEDIQYILDAVPELGFVLDMGNFFCIGEDVLKAYDIFKDKIVRCHCKDWAFNPYGVFLRENMPRFEGVVLGDGVLPLKELFEKFRNDKLDCSVVLEINAQKVSLNMLDRSIEFLRGEMCV